MATEGRSPAPTDSPVARMNPIQGIIRAAIDQLDLKRIADSIGLIRLECDTICFILDFQKPEPLLVWPDGVSLFRFSRCISCRKYGIIDHGRSSNEQKVCVAKGTLGLADQGQPQARCSLRPNDMGRWTGR